MTPTRTAFALAACLPGLWLAQTAEAEPNAPKADLSPGAFVMVTRSYHSDTNTLTEGAPSGEAKACFQVVEQTDEGVVLAHVSGIFHPWWSEAPILPGSSDVWFTSDAWRANNPGAGKLDEVHVIFSNVPSCASS